MSDIKFIGVFNVDSLTHTELKKYVTTLESSLIEASRMLFEAKELGGDKGVKELTEKHNKQLPQSAKNGDFILWRFDY